MFFIDTCLYSSFAAYILLRCYVVDVQHHEAHRSAVAFEVESKSVGNGFYVVLVTAVKLHCVIMENRALVDTWE
jgi:hypothetical protein